MCNVNYLIIYYFFVFKSYGLTISFEKSVKNNSSLTINNLPSSNDTFNENNKNNNSVSSINNSTYQLPVRNIRKILSKSVSNFKPSVQLDEIDESIDKKSSDVNENKTVDPTEFAKFNSESEFIQQPTVHSPNQRIKFVYENSEEDYTTPTPKSSSNLKVNENNYALVHQIYYQQPSYEYVTSGIPYQTENVEYQYEIPGDNNYYHPGVLKNTHQTVNPEYSTHQPEYQYQYVVPESEKVVEKPTEEYLNPPTYPQHYYYQYDGDHDDHDDKSNNNFKDPSYQVHKKPDILYYLTSHRHTSVTRTRKYPYQFYPYHQHHHYNYDNPKPVIYNDSLSKRPSPWNKIIGLIGAALPLGLLLAALKTPNIIKPNTTQPNIVLSRFRALHLPVEHKSSPDDDDSDFILNYNSSICKEKIVCESILQDKEINVDVMHDTLWKFFHHQRSMTVDNENVNIEDILKAMKSRDCDLIKCSVEKEEEEAKENVFQ